MEQNKTRVQFEVVLFNTFYPEYATAYDDLMNIYYCEKTCEEVVQDLYKFALVFYKK